MPEDLVAFIHRLRLGIAGSFPFLVPKKRDGIHLYLLTIALMGLALSVRLALAPVSAGLQYVTFFPAVAIAAIVGGYRAGLFATIIGVALATIIFTPPYFSLSIDVAQASFWADMVFLAGGTIVSFSIEAMHRFRQQYQQKLKEVQESRAHVIKLNEELEKQIIERRRAESALARHIRDLGERIKEIECLRDITDLLLNEEMSVRQVLGACARRLPAGWLDPSHTCARIRLGEQTYESASFRETEWKLAAAISMSGMGQGLVEVFYFGEGAGDGKSPFLDEERTLIQSISIQISQLLEKRLAEAELQQNQAELREAQRIAHVGSWRLDAVTSHVVWSEQLYCMLGLSPELPVPDYTEHHKLFTPESWKRLSTTLPQALETGIPYEVELEAVRADGKHIWMLARGEAIRDASGAIAGLHGVAMDITGRKQAEHALTESMHKLEEKELAKTRFFAAAGHDLRQPLAAANLFIDALKFGELTPQQNKIIQQLDQSMTTFKGLLDTLLNISKLDSDVIKAEHTPVNVTEVFNWLEQNFAPMAGEKQIGLKLYFPMRETLVVTSDMGLLDSVLMNLVSNAIKFTARGAILVSARKRASEVLFQVWDTGIGIADENIEHIFDEFYQIDNPQRDRTSGLGLGLAIAKRAIALLGSEITCRSRIGRGSVFEFRLPLCGSPGRVAQQGAVVAPQEDAVNDSFARGNRFVVVEDDALVAQAMTNWLEGMGGEVKNYHSAEDALLNANIEYADYYIVDYMLGGMLTGVQFLDLLHQKLGKPIKAVLMTGDTSSTFIRDTADFDWPVLYKPVNTFKLISSLKAQAR